ncbi:MAG: DUF4340 domain-containing protein [Alkalispirochaetaceae bacterium]
MTNRNTPILAGLLAVLLGAYLILTLAGGDRNSRRVTLPQEPRRIEVSAPGGAYSIVRSGEQWILEPLGERADGQRIEELLPLITGERRLLVASAGGAGRFGLAGEEAVSLTYEGEQMRLGAPSASGSQVYMGLEGREEVFLLERRVREILEAGEEGLRDDVVRRTAESSITSVTVVVPGRTVEITRRPEAPPPETAFENEVDRIDATWRASEESVEPFQLENFFQELRTLRANGFQEPRGSLEEAGRIEVRLEGGQTETVRLLDRGEGAYQLVGPGLPEDALVLAWRARRLTLGLLEE